jgi:hypothetical protein
VTELARRLAAGEVRGLSDLGHLLARADHGLWSVPTPAHPGPPADTVGAAREVAQALSRLFGVTVLDCGHGLTAAAPVLTDAHAVVIATPATVDGVRSTRVALERQLMTRGGADPGRIVIVLTSITPRPEVADVPRAVGVLEALGVPVVHLGFDRQLACGGVIQPRRLAGPTVVAVTRVAALTLRRAQPR